MSWLAAPQLRYLLLLLFVSLAYTTTCHAQNDQDLDKDVIRLIPQNLRNRCPDKADCYCVSYAPGERSPLDPAKTQYCPDKAAGLVRYTAWNDPGTKIEEGQYKNAIKEGLWVTWHPNGKKAEEQTFSEGKRNGTRSLWFDNGQMNFQVRYVNNKAHGKWVGWHRNGKQAVEVEYVDGKEVGPLTAWHETGQLRHQGYYSRSGKKEGAWISWHRNGIKAEETRFVDGKENGATTLWYDNGQVQERGGFFNGRAKDGEWSYWDRSGKPLRKEVWDKGRVLAIEYLSKETGKVVAPVERPASNCAPEERIYFSCTSGKKLISLCGSALPSPAGTLTYRIGYPGKKPEMIYPTGDVPTKNAFTFYVGGYAKGNSGQVTFSVGEYTYTIFSEQHVFEENVSGVFVEHAGEFIGQLRCAEERPRHEMAELYKFGIRRVEYRILEGPTP